LEAREYSAGAAALMPRWRVDYIGKKGQYRAERSL
jgi:hypothetical protein